MSIFRRKTSLDYIKQIIKIAKRAKLELELAEKTGKIKKTKKLLQIIKKFNFTLFHIIEKETRSKELERRCHTIQGLASEALEEIENFHTWKKAEETINTILKLESFILSLDQKLIGKQNTIANLYDRANLENPISQRLINLVLAKQIVTHTPALKSAELSGNMIKTVQSFLKHGIIAFGLTEKILGKKPKGDAPPYQYHMDARFQFAYYIYYIITNRVKELYPMLRNRMLIYYYHLLRKKVFWSDFIRYMESRYNQMWIINRKTGPTSKKELTKELIHKYNECGKEKFSEFHPESKTWRDHLWKPLINLSVWRFSELFISTNGAAGVKAYFIKHGVVRLEYDYFGFLIRRPDMSRNPLTLGETKGESQDYLVYKQIFPNEFVAVVLPRYSPIELVDIIPKSIPIVTEELKLIPRR